jgi:hypothetical protein
VGGAGLRGGARPRGPVPSGTPEAIARPRVNGPVADIGGGGGGALPLPLPPLPSTSRRLPPTTPAWAPGGEGHSHLRAPGGGVFSFSLSSEAHPLEVPLPPFLGRRRPLPRGVFFEDSGLRPEPRCSGRCATELRRAACASREARRAAWASSELGHAAGASTELGHAAGASTELRRAACASMELPRAARSSTVLMCVGGSLAEPQSAGVS